MSEYSPTPLTLACRESGDEDRTDLEMRNETEKYTIGSVDAEYAPHIVKCVNLHDEFAIACEAALSDFYHELDSQLTEPTEKMLKSVLAKAKGEA